VVVEAVEGAVEEVAFDEVEFKDVGSWGEGSCFPILFLAGARFLPHRRQVLEI